MNWRSPFALPDPLSFDDLQACELLTERPVNSLPAIPRITLRRCENEASEDIEIIASTIEGSTSCSDADSSKSRCNSDHFADQHCSISSSQSSGPQPEKIPYNAWKSTYVPYRPWYSPSEPPSSSGDSPTRDYVATDNHRPPPLAGLQHTHTNGSSIYRRASTGDLPAKTVCKSAMAGGRTRSSNIGNFDTCPSSEDSNHAIIRVNMQRSRSASAPELTCLVFRPIISNQAEPTADVSSPPAEHNVTTRTDSRAPSGVPRGIRTSLKVPRIGNICNSWNSRQWAKAESYLTHHLGTLITSGDHERARRVRHILGVCASYRGHWQRALTLFVSVVRTPVEDVQKIDCGDRAALRWLADTYALMNRREEALLACCLAGACSQPTSALGSASSRRCLLADQEQLRHTVSKAAFKAVWADEAFRSGRADDDEILHSTIVSQSVAQACLQVSSTRADQCNIHSPTNTSKSQEKANRPEAYQISISPVQFEPDSPWPLPYDATFSITNVVQNRLCAQESDLLEALQQRPETMLPRKSLSLRFSRTFPCEELTRLITALRESLQVLAMSWTEIVHPKDVNFLVRYSSLQDGIATINYFKIEVVRISLFTEYGLVLRSGSTSSARTALASNKSTRRINAATERELKTCLRTTFNTLYKRHRAANPSQTQTPTPPPPPPPPKDSTAETTASLLELGSSHSSPRSSIEAPPLHDISALLPPSSLSKPKPSPPPATSSLEIPE